MTYCMYNMIYYSPEHDLVCKKNLKRTDKFAQGTNITVKIAQKEQKYVEK